MDIAYMPAPVHRRLYPSVGGRSRRGIVGGYSRPTAYILRAVNLLSFFLFPVSCFLFSVSQGGGKHTSGHATDVTGVDNTPENREKKKELKGTTPRRGVVVVGHPPPGLYIRIF